MWLNIASANGNENARKARDIIAAVMTSDQLAEAQRLARECVKKDVFGPRQTAKIISTNRLVNASNQSVF